MDNKLNHLIALIRSPEFDNEYNNQIWSDTFVDGEISIANFNTIGEEAYRDLVEEYIDALIHYSDIDAYGDETDVKVLVSDFILYQTS
jgi:hypothetical protein